MFGQVGATEFDVRFELFGVPVRIHPVFWLTSAFLGWNGTFFLTVQGPIVVPSGTPEAVIVRVICILFAILVHELGHALVNVRFGYPSEITLYFLGGYATSTRHYNTWRDIAVSAAGPGAGFLLLLAIWLPCRLTGLVLNFSPFFPVFDTNVLAAISPAIGFGTKGCTLILVAIQFSFFINFVWNVMNLLPVLPLDGGQISRELFLYFRRRDGMQRCLQLSTLVGGSVAAYALYQESRDGAVFGLEPLFLGIMFGLLAFQSYQALQQHDRGY